MLAVFLAAFGAASASAQDRKGDFFDLVMAGTPQEIQAAIDRGADVNEALPMDDSQGSGKTPLMCAAKFNANPEAIAVLLKAGADIEAQNYHGWTALVYAAKNNRNPEVVMTLLSAGADAKVTDDYGQTVLDYARSNFSLRGTDALRRLEAAAARRR